MIQDPNNWAALLFLVPAVFAMLAAPFWIWIRLRAPSPPGDERDPREPAPAPASEPSQAQDEHA